MALEFVAGCVGGGAGVAVGYPFDTIKVKLQTQDGARPQYRGTWHCFRSTLKTESVRGLYRGMSSPMAGVSVVNAIVFGVHGNIMKRVEDPTALSSQALAGGSAGFIQAFVASPMELAKTRMQIQSSAGGVTYTSPLHCLKSIVRAEGARGLFRGQAVTVMREVPGFATYFASYDLLLSAFTSEDEDPSAGGILMAGGLAGTASWVLTYPVDVVKSRLQADGMRGRQRYRGAWHCLKSSVSTEGVSVLGRGLTSTIVRAFPTNAATFAVVSYVMKVGAQVQDALEDGHAVRDLVARGELLLSSAVNAVNLS